MFNAFLTHGLLKFWAARHKNVWRLQGLHPQLVKLCRCFSARAVPLSASPARTHEKRAFSTSGMSPRAMRLPSAADALRGQPRCHRAFVSPSLGMRSSARASPAPHTSPRSITHLDLTCPEDRLKFDAHMARQEGQTASHRPWDGTCGSISTSPTFSGTKSSAFSRSSTSPKINVTGHGNEHARPAAVTTSHVPGQWDPCSSLDASQLQHLRTCSQGGSLSASGLVEFHSTSCEHAEDSLQPQLHSGVSVDGTEASQSSPFDHAGACHLQNPEQIDAAVPFQNDASRNVAVLFRYSRA